VEIANPAGKLKPGMFAAVEFPSTGRKGTLLVPSEAVIRTGQRDVVVVADEAQDGKQRFRTAEVEVGAESGGMTEIRKGLERGMKVVTSGQFLIDSESSLKAGGARFGEAPAPQAPEGHGDRAGGEPRK